MGRKERQVGATQCVDGYEMEFTHRLGDRGEKWRCGKCRRPVAVSPVVARRRGHRLLFERHMRGCTEIGRCGQGGPRLFVVGGAALLVVVRGAFRSNECQAAVEALPSSGYELIGLNGAKDTRRQVTFSVRGSAGGAQRVVKRVIDCMGLARSGWVLRGGESVRDPGWECGAA
jgi:hypothetical protein